MRTSWIAQPSLQISFCVFVAIFSCGLIWLNRQFLSPSPILPLAIDEGELNFGEVFLTNSFEHTLMLKNTSASVLDITGFRTSCACTSISPAKIEIRPNESAPVTITIDLSTRDNVRLAQPTWDFSVSLLPLFESAPADYVPWTIRGRVRNPFRSPISSLQPMSTVYYGKGFPDFSAELTPQTRLTSVSGEITGTAFSVTVTLVGGENGTQSVPVVVHQNPSLQPGRYEETLTILAHAAAGEIARYPIVVRSEILTDVQLVPNVLAFGLCDVGTELVGELNLVSRSGRPFEILGTGACDNLMVTQRSDKSGAAVKIRIHATNTPPAPMSIRIRESTAVEYELPLDVRYVAQ